MKLPQFSHHLWFADWIARNPIPYHRPEFVYLDVFDGCDGVCCSCLLAQTPGKPISDELFSHIVREMRRWGVRELSLSTNGEPTLHPDLPRLVANASEKGLEVYFATGGHHIDSALAKGLITANVSGIAVSLETLDNDQTIPSSWERSLAGMDALLRARGGSITPRLTIILPLPSNISPPAMENLTKMIKGRLGYCPDALMALHRHDWHHTYPGIQTKQAHPHFACQHPWRGLYLSRAGEVITCYFDPTHRQVLDQVMNKRLADIWRGKPLQAVRSAHRSHSFLNLPLCAHCHLPDRAHPIGYLGRILAEQWRFGRRTQPHLQWYY